MLVEFWRPLRRRSHPVELDRCGDELEGHALGGLCLADVPVRYHLGIGHTFQGVLGERPLSLEVRQAVSPLGQGGRREHPTQNLAGGTGIGRQQLVRRESFIRDEVLTPDGYRHLDALNDRIVSGCEAVIERHQLPGYAIGVGSKGCVTFSTERIVDYETFKANQDEAVTELAWLWNMNRGIYMTPGREVEWTLSVTHTDEAIDAYVAAFDEMAAALTA